MNAIANAGPGTKHYNPPVLDFIATSWRTVVALLILVLLPGIVLVRAPWPTVPALSISFWILSWFVMPGEGSGRSGFVRAAVVSFFLLGLLRVLQPRLWSRPPPWAVLTAAIAILTLVPWARVEMPLLPDLSLDAASSRLLLWRDGIPRSFEPLLPGRPFVSGAPGFQMLAADVAALGDGAVHRSVFLAQRLGTALWVLGIAYALMRLGTAGGTLVALGATVSAIGIDLVPGRFPAVAGAVDLAAALLTFVLVLVLRRSSRSATVAAAFMGLAAWAVLPGVSLLPVAAAVAAWVAGAVLVVRALSSCRERVVAVAAVVLTAGYASLVIWTPRPAFTPAVQRAASWAAANLQPLDLICNGEGDSGRWIPALAGRAVTHPGLPHASIPPPGNADKACRIHYDDGRRGARRSSGVELFRDGDVALWRDAE